MISIHCAVDRHRSRQTTQIQRTSKRSRYLDVQGLGLGAPGKLMLKNINSKMNNLRWSSFEIISHNKFMGNVENLTQQVTVPGAGDFSASCEDGSEIESSDGTIIFFGTPGGSIAPKSSWTLPMSGFSLRWIVMTCVFATQLCGAQKNTRVSPAKKTHTSF